MIFRRWLRLRRGPSAAEGEEPLHHPRRTPTSCGDCLTISAPGCVSGKLSWGCTRWSACIGSTRNGRWGTFGRYGGPRRNGSGVVASENGGSIGSALGGWGWDSGPSLASHDSPIVLPPSYLSSQEEGTTTTTPNITTTTEASGTTSPPPPATTNLVVFVTPTTTTATPPYRVGFFFLVVRVIVVVGEERRGHRGIQKTLDLVTHPLRWILSSWVGVGFVTASVCPNTTIQRIYKHPTP